MNLNPEDFETIKKLEESLWIEETRFDTHYMHQILTDDFFEFGRSGHTYNRDECLKVKKDALHANLPLLFFNATYVSPETVLVTYISEVKYETLERSKRSSLWVKKATGWQLKFHQGTPFNDSSDSPYGE